jgi:serine/threonine protein kinase
MASLWGSAGGDAEGVPLGAPAAGAGSPPANEAPEAPVTVLSPPSAAADVPPPLPAPYVAIRKLGEGTFGQAWLACDPASPAERVVVKVTKNAASERDQQEADLLRALPPHPHVVGYRSHAVTPDGRLQLVLEYAPGGDLRDHVADAGAAWSWREAAAATAQVAAGVAHAHAQPKPVIHRDIKPANVLVDGTGRMKLADFGSAKAAATTATLVHSAARVGSLLYMAPEVQRGVEYSAAVDVWSLGVMLHCLLLQMAGEDTGVCSPFVDPAEPSLGRTLANLHDGRTHLSRPPRPWCCAACWRGC